MTSTSSNLRFDEVYIQSPGGQKKPQITLRLEGNPPISYIGTLGENETDQFGANVTVTAETPGSYAVGELRFVGVTRVGALIVGGNLGWVDPITGAGTPVVVKESIADLVVLGNLHAQLQAQGAGVSIGRLEVRGAIGQSGQQNIGRIWTKGDIDEIKAGVIYSPIEPGFLATPPGTRKKIRLLQCTTESGFTGGGHFKGWLIAERIGSESGIFEARVRINGDLDGYVDLSGGVDDFNRFQPPGQFLVPTFLVDGSFLDGVQGPDIVLPANGLRGRIIFNQADGLAQWAQGAEIAVGSRTLTNALYPDLPSLLGDGSAGLARFNLHGGACEPTSGQTVSAGIPPNIIIEDPTCQQLEHYAESPVEVVVLHHYGPVIFEPVHFSPSDARSVPPVTIEQRPLGGGNWENVLNDYYAVGVNSPGELDNAIEIRRRDGGKWPVGKQFQIRSTPGLLKCVSVDGTPPVASYTYTFSIRFKCEDTLLDLFDLDGSNTLGLSDMATWLASPADVTRDGATSGQDLSALGEGIAEYQSLPPN